MTLADIEITGFRSIRKLRMPLRRLTVLVGGNGVGKTNLYRSLELLQAAARGTLADEIAREGGLSSVFWAGGRNLTEDGSFDPMWRTDGYRKGEQLRLALEAHFEGLGDEAAFDPTYRIEIGFPPKTATAAFSLEAQIKREEITLPHRGRRTMLMERANASVAARDETGARITAADGLLASETALATIRGGQPEIAVVRDELSAWRFFHGFRSDPDSPLRRPALAITAPLLNADGGNLAAVFATLRHIREETVDLDAAIEAAFPSAELVVPLPEQSATFGMIFPEMPKRVFRAHELSDGTLQFLALCGALLSYRLPPFIALNEPESSLHPKLLPVLASLIVNAAARTQIWVVTHSRELADAISQQSGVLAREVIRTEDGTTISGLGSLGTFDDEPG